MRHVLVHGYYQIEPEQLWETITTDIPALKTQIDAIKDDISWGFVILKTKNDITQQTLDDWSN